MSELTLDQLFSEAEKYGRVASYQHKDKTYSTIIEFNLGDGSCIEFRSGYYHKTREESIASALSKASGVLVFQEQETKQEMRTGGSNKNATDDGENKGLLSKIKSMIFKS